MVQLYIRLRTPADIGNRINLLCLMLEEDFCLDEAAVLYQKLRPAYMSLAIIKNGLETIQWQWTS